MTQSISEVLEQLANQPGDDGAVAAPEPGGISDINQSFPGSKVESAGYVYIWDTETGKQSVCNRNMLQSSLGKTRKDGSRVFTTIKPDFEPSGGTFKCMLHADDENRELYNSLGLAVCIKDNLDSPYQVTRHMKTRHSQEWETIDDINATAQRDEDREFQRLLIRAAAQGTTAPAPTKPDTDEQPPKQLDRSAGAMIGLQCGECGEEVEGINKMIASNRMKAHAKREHGG